MNNILQEYRQLLRNRYFVTALGISVISLLLGIVFSYLAVTYATEKASNPVTDIVLNNIPVFDVDGIFVYGPVVFWSLAAVYLFFKPVGLPFTFKSIALFLFVRSFFVSLTHIGPFPNELQIHTGGLFSFFTNGKDLFFSSHTGLPYLAALIFWEDKYMRYFCLAGSLVFGAVVLLGHLHYSIDVMGAFFVTYSIFRLAEIFFQKDRNFMLAEKSAGASNN